MWPVVLPGRRHQCSGSNKIASLQLYTEGIVVAVQLYAVDHSARVSMKSAANCVNSCESQTALNIDILNAHCGYRLACGHV